MASNLVVLQQNVPIADDGGRPTSEFLRYEQLLRTRIAALEVEPALELPTLNAPWVNYGGGFLGARYFKTPQGLVTIEGLIQAAAGPITGVTLFTLLPGYRPSGTLMFATYNGGGAGRIDVQANGNVVMQLGNLVFTSLSGITFVAA